MNSTLRRSEEAVIVVEMLFLLLAIAVMRVLFSPGSRALTSVLVLWTVLLTASYLAGEFETNVRVNYGLSLRTQAAFALAYVAYSGIHVIWPWCESLSVRFWLGLWGYLSLVAPLLGLLVRRIIQQRVLLVTGRHQDKVPLLRWWGFQCDDCVPVSGLAEWLREHADEHGWVGEFDMIAVDVTDPGVEYDVAGIARDYFVDFVGISSFAMSGYLIGPHPHHIGAYSLHGVARRLKRMIDLLLSGTAIGLLSPLFLVVAALIKLTSPGPVFYRHKRLGRNMREFWLLKFRTMYRDADRRLEQILRADPDLEREFRETFKLKKDPRITRIGNVLRRFSIDELPQFFNIVSGQMSLVGPRPIVLKEVEYYKSYSLLLFRVLPGATGLWQVSGRSETSYEKRVELDTRYVQAWTLLWDLKIIFMTVPAILRRRGAY